MQCHQYVVELVVIIICLMMAQTLQSLACNAHNPQPQILVHVFPPVFTLFIQKFIIHISHQVFLSVFIRHEIKIITYPNKGDLHNFIGLSVPVFPYHIYEFIELNLLKLFKGFNLKLFHQVPRSSMKKLPPGCKTSLTSAPTANTSL